MTDLRWPTRPGQRTLWAALVVLLVWAPDVFAHEQGYGFAYADQPTTGFYNPAPFRSYNDGGGDIEILRITTGSYLVTFEGLEDLGSEGGHVQVTSADPDTHYCTGAGWTDNLAVVNCFTIAGVADDARFNVLFIRPDSHNNDYGFLLVLDGTLSTPTLSESNTYNAGSSAGATVTRYRTGHYSIRWTNLESVGDGPRIDLVTAQSTNARCQVSSTVPDGFNVRCHGPAGIAADTQFAALSMRTEDTADGLGFASADSPFSNSYVILPDDSYNASGPGDVTSTRIDTGEYRLSWDGLDTVGINLGSLQVSADSFYDRLCGVASSDADSVTVKCVNSLGISADSAFRALFVKPPKKAWANRYGYVRANQATNPNYTISDSYHANPLNSTSRIFRNSTGRYQYEATGFDEWGAYGQAQVSAVGNSSRNCQLNTWYDEVVETRCYSMSGALTDTQFSALYIKPDTDLSAVAYAYANLPTFSSYTPSAPESWNPSGGAITATRSSTGVYSISFAGFSGFGTGGGNVQVTARNIFPTTCQLSSWGGGTANVRCFSLISGNPVDSAYAVMIMRPDANHAALAYAWTNDPTASSYTPSTSFTFNSSNQGVTANRSSTGVYTLTFSGFAEQGIDQGTVVVSAYGSTATVCNPSFWIGGIVSVRCFDTSGNLVDSRYSLLWVKETNNTRLDEDYTPVPEPSFPSALAIGLLWLGCTSGARARSRSDQVMPRE